MYHTSNEKRQTTHDGWSRTTKSSKNQNARRKGNLQILENIGNNTIKQVEMKEKNLKKNISEEPEYYSGQNYIAGTL